MDPGENYSETVLKFSEISVDTIDLIDDAWGFRHQFPDVYSLLNRGDLRPSESLLSRLFSMVDTGGGEEEL